MNVEFVRHLSTNDLCQWLKTQLDEDEWKDAKRIIQTQKIKGKNFLDCPEEKWEKFGLAWGVANSLFQIAQKVLGNRAADVHEINMDSVDDILAFLVSQMHDTSKFHCAPHVLSETSRSFALNGRDDALMSAAKAFKVLSKPVGTTDQTQRKIPVCSGLSGLGKTRMLEEWKRIFDLAEISNTRLGVLVLYYNGHMPQPIESLMPIEASFSWRLLYRLFLERNGPIFADWMKDKLPVNARNLRLRTALKIIHQHVISRGDDIAESDCLHMFIGIDEYQSIEDVKGLQVSKVGGLLQDLLNSLGDILAAPVHGIRLYPMFAGTDFSIMSIANASNTGTIRVPMTLLSAAEIEEAVRSAPLGSNLLNYTPVRRHLFYFGGVARWAIEYMKICWKP
jgi:hypothetical protein